MADNNPIKVYFDVLIEAMNKMGRPPARIERMKKYLEDAGFVDIQTHSIKQPFGPWPREVALKQVGAMV